uniref:Smg4_UPF3 domain-containing protein n=1 Tax=Caenorhabditis tropicalis TaxID=1561998 RepID=A0A1I7UF15_9PELO
MEARRSSPAEEILKLLDAPEETEAIRRHSNPRAKRGPGASRRSNDKRSKPMTKKSKGPNPCESASTKERENRRSSSKNGHRDETVSASKKKITLKAHTPNAGKSDKQHCDEQKDQTSRSRKRSAISSSPGKPVKRAATNGEKH